MNCNLSLARLAYIYMERLRFICVGSCTCLMLLSVTLCPCAPAAASLMYLLLVTWWIMLAHEALTHGFAKGNEISTCIGCQVSSPTNLYHEVYALMLAKGKGPAGKSAQ